MFFNAKYSGLKIYLFYADKGNGKSLYQAYLIEKLLKSYKKIERRYPSLPKRQLFVNQPLSLKLEETEFIYKIKRETKFYNNKEFIISKETEIINNPNGHLRYWAHPEELYNVKDSDILWDEIGKDLPAGDWANTPKELRQVFSHLRKRGNRLFANTQVYEDIDVAFRRQIDKAFKLEKVFGNRDISASLPPVKRIWGMIMLTKFDPKEIEVIRDETKRRRLALPSMPHWIWIKRKRVELYDTRAELPPYQPDKLRERVLVCREGEMCQKKDKHGEPHKIVIHEPV